MPPMKQWPQAGGPDGDGQTRARGPLRWSVARNQNVLWRTPLPETGQSGIALAKDRLFLATLRPLPDARAKKDGGDVVGHCVDARTGKLLWSVDLPAAEESPYAYGFSDASSPTPVTDGRRVWFVNASGHIACCDLSGRVLWRRAWKPTTGRPFNKQFEPILDAGVLLNVEPRDPDDFRRERDPWNWLRALDPDTGKTLWTAEDPLTHYNTPVRGRAHDGRPAVLIGRGGYHDVPETPVGLSLVSLAPEDAGKTLWRFVGGGKAQYNMHWNRRHAFWIDQDRATHTVLDARDGRVVRTDPLDVAATWRRRDGDRFVTETNVRFREKGITVFPAWFTNAVVERWHWFLCFSNPEPAYGIGPCGPLYCVGRVDIHTGRVEYLELPTTPSGEYRSPVAAGTVNHRGIDVASDPRSRRDGWHWVFLGAPLVADGRLYWTLQNGIVYVVDGRAKVLDERALLAVNDLGPLGQTWSLGTPTVAGGRLYHRTMKELVCIGG